MEVTILKIVVLWICTSLIFLLGDVLRIFKGDFVMGEIEGKKATQAMFMFIAGLMVIPIVLAVSNLLLPTGIVKVANIIFAGLFFVMNLFGIPTYKGYYDRFLLAISLIFNILVIIYALGL